MELGRQLSSKLYYVIYKALVLQKAPQLNFKSEFGWIFQSQTNQHHNEITYTFNNLHWSS